MSGPAKHPYRFDPDEIAQGCVPTLEGKTLEDLGALVDAGEAWVAPRKLDATAFVGVDTLVVEGKKILAEGLPYIVDGMIPGYGVVGFLVAGAKVGKTTTGLSMIAAVAGGADEFLGRRVRRTKVLMLALEDPREYLAVLVASTFKGGEAVTFYTSPAQLDDATLDELAGFVHENEIGMVYVATFLNAVRSLVGDENDNVGMVRVVSSLKMFARRIGVPVLFEAHAGKGEDLSEDADPVKALRGASAAGAEADFILSLTRAEKGFGNVRRLSGLGRFVSFPPITFTLDTTTGEVEVASSDRSAFAETDWLQIVETGAITTEPRSPGAIARAAGFVADGKSPDRAIYRRVAQALRGRDGVVSQTTGKDRNRRTKYALAEREGFEFVTTGEGDRGSPEKVL